MTWPCRAPPASRSQKECQQLPQQKSQQDISIKTPHEAGVPMGLVPYSAAAAPKGATNSGDCASASATMPRCATCWRMCVSSALDSELHGSTRLLGVEAERHRRRRCAVRADDTCRKQRRQQRNTATASAPARTEAVCLGLVAGHGRRPGHHHRARVELPVQPRCAHAMSANNHSATRADARFMAAHAQLTSISACTAAASRQLAHLRAWFLSRRRCLRRQRRARRRRW